MKQYVDLLKHIKVNGIKKSSSENNTLDKISVFGYQYRYNSQEGIPTINNSKNSFKESVHEILWMLSGDSNIRYLTVNNITTWNQDAYNFYCKLCNERNINKKLDFDIFMYFIRFSESFQDLQELTNDKDFLRCIMPEDYILGDLGYSTGKAWRIWGEREFEGLDVHTDQIKNLIKGLKANPSSNKHILVSVDPVYEIHTAVYWHHINIQFNCRKISIKEKAIWISKNKDNKNIPKFNLDCQIYQRDADALSKLSSDITIYLLLLNIIAKLCNMVPGEFVHTFGNLSIKTKELPKLNKKLNSRTKLSKLDMSEAFNLRDLDMYLPISNADHFKLIK